MNHCEYQRLLSHYLDRQLDADTTQRLGMHLPHCPRCCRELKELNDIRQVCMNMPEVEIPEGLHESIMNKIRCEGEKSKLSWARRAIIPIAAALLIFFISRGLPDKLNNMSTQTADKAFPENLLMALSEDGDAEEDLFGSSTQDEIPAPAAGSPDDSTDGADSSTDTQPANYSENKILAAADMVSDSETKLERPDYFRYGILIAAILAFGMILLKTLKPRR